MATRTVLITGAASGIGKATATRVRAGGSDVVGVDLADVEVDADLSTRDGRDQLSAALSARGSPIGGVIACAGVSVGHPTARMVSVNYFGAVETLERAHQWLERATEPRAAVVSSGAIAWSGFSPDLVDACLGADEDGAIAVAADMDPVTVYTSTKLALARWLRTAAPGSQWAGRGIPLNGLAPGVVDTPMMHASIARPDRAAALAEAIPMPLGGFASAEEMATVLCWLISPENSKMTGQIIFVDGGAEALASGDDIWSMHGSLRRARLGLS